jgi:hypothetical protein
MPEKLEMFVLITSPIASTPFHQVNKNSCRVHHSYLITMFIFASITGTDISIMSKIEGEANVLERYDLVELTIPSLKPMKWKR